MSWGPVGTGSVGVGPVGPAGTGPGAGSCEGSRSRVEEKDEVLDLGRNKEPQQKSLSSMLNSQKSSVKKLCTACHRPEYGTTQ